MNHPHQDRHERFLWEELRRAKLKETSARDSNAPGYIIEALTVEARKALNEYLRFTKSHEPKQSLPANVIPFPRGGCHGRK